VEFKKKEERKKETKIVLDYNMGVIDRKIDLITAGLGTGISKNLGGIAENITTVVSYILSMKTEANPSDNYRKDTIVILTKFSKFHNNRPFKLITREDILSFLDSFRKPEASDPMHKWIGTYNIYRIHLLRFFKWLYYPDIEPAKRPKPSIVENIPQLKRKEKSIYVPTDLWDAKDNLLFLKYCPSKRNKCFHAMSYDTGCRPHELLQLRIRDIVFKSVGNRSYAEITVNGKTGSRSIPLIDSIPYVKDYLDHEHPFPGNPNAIFLAGLGKSLGRSLCITALDTIYSDYKQEYFAKKLLSSPDVPPEDKQKIKELLKKPWNPYIRRHSALTEKSRILKEHTQRQFAGWTNNSNMPQKYLHYFGNESCESLLEAYGIVTKDQQHIDLLRPKECPNCNEPNKPDSRFCAKCRMVLTYDAYSETLESQKQRDDKLDEMAEQMNRERAAMNSEMRAMNEEVRASLESCNREMDKLRPAGKELRSIMDNLGPVLEKLGIKIEKQTG
jgi:integrase